MDKSTHIIWTASQGIMKQRYIARVLTGELKHIRAFSKNQQGSINDSDVVIGWGNKKNTQKAIRFAQQNKLRFIKAEDGFIGYIGHPAKQGHPLSVITDEIGIFYDARQPSRLEQLITQANDDILLQRANDLIKKIATFGITKYNCYDNSELPLSLVQRFSLFDQPTILLIDQVAGDLSISGALATEADFVAMVEQARINHPSAQLLLRTHPDTRFGKKKGVLANLKLSGLTIIDEACHPHALIKQVDAVYTVSSQMGFEALLLGKAVYCFGMPFYAGWGLTTDTKICSRRGTASLEQLVAGALINYPKYYDPILAQPCEVEAVVDLINLQYRPTPQCSTLFLVGFSLWKRAFLTKFCRHLAKELKFVSKPPTQLNKQDQILVWGAKHPDLASCIRVEDGFIRSNGLGSNLCPPSSLSFDPDGIYFDSRSPSRLEVLFSNYRLNNFEISRAEQLITCLQATKVSKYNIGKSASFEPPKTDKDILLVVGQVDGDASIITGSPNIKSNEALLWAIRQEKPDAYIIYKPHPDVVSGNRAGSITSECLDACVDQQIVDIELSRLFSCITELHTMTSLSGFEALIQNVKVVTWGQPFYASWGLTTDMNPLPRREAKLDLAALVYLTLVKYPSYIDWPTGLWSTPEQLIAKLSQQQNAVIKSTNIWQRCWIKMIALWKTGL